LVVVHLVVSDPNQYAQRLEKRREYDRLWRKANPDKVRAKSLRHRLAHPDADRNRKRDPKRLLEYRLAYRERQRSRSHGLTRAEMAQVLAQQNGCCAICASTSPKGKHWHGDHDHATNKFRGVLCHKCNVGLGMFEDVAARLRAAADYIDKHAEVKGSM
jgi:hypothetical protein